MDRLDNAETAWQGLAGFRLAPKSIYCHHTQIRVDQSHKKALLWFCPNHVAMPYQLKTWPYLTSRFEVDNRAISITT